MKVVGGTWTQAYWVFKLVHLGTSLILHHLHLHVVPDSTSRNGSFTGFCFSLTFATLWKCQNHIRLKFYKRAQGFWLK